MIDIKAIRAAAEAATPGPWKQTNGVLRGSDGSDVVASNYGLGHGFASRNPYSNCKRQANGEFLKMIDPSALIALCDEIERLRKDAGRYQWLAAYLVSTSNQYDDLIVEASETSVEELNAAIDAVISNKIELSNKRGI